MKVQELGALVREKDDIILRLSGNTLAIAAPERTVGRDELSEDDGSSSVPILPRWSDGVCERNTGGTRFFSECLSSRNASCVTTWGLRTPWFAYKDLMLWGQFCFARIVAMKEALYFVNLLLATCFSPGYLLLAPFSEKNKGWKLAYLLSPESVVMFSLGGASRELDEFARISYLVNIAASLSAWIALVIGFFDHGTMFPSLAVGYLLSGLSPMGALAFMTPGV